MGHKSNETKEFRNTIIASQGDYKLRGDSDPFTFLLLAYLFLWAHFSYSLVFGVLRICLKKGMRGDQMKFSWGDSIFFAFLWASVWAGALTCYVLDWKLNGCSQNCGFFTSRKN